MTYSDYYFGVNPDVDVEEMKKSDSKSKYVHGICWRMKIPLKITANEDEFLDERKRKTLKQKAKRSCNIM